MNARMPERFDRYGPIRLMAAVDGWVMARRPGRSPALMSWSEWCELSERPVRAGATEEPAGE